MGWGSGTLASSKGRGPSPFFYHIPVLPRLLDNLTTQWPQNPQVFLIFTYTHFYIHSRGAGRMWAQVRTEIGTGILCDLGCMALHLSPCLGNELLGEIQELGHLHRGQGGD